MLSKCIFDSLAELSAYFGTVITLPENTPDDCNVICFHVSFKGDIKFFQVCKEDKQGFFNLGCNDKWEKSSDSLEDEVRFDKCLVNSHYVYLRLAAKDNSDVFTPERLLGVETDKGFITNVVEIGFYDIMKPSYYVYTTESLSKEDLYDVHSIKYYISDDSDETVSFDTM